MLALAVAFKPANGCVAPRTYMGKPRALDTKSSQTCSYYFREPPPDGVTQKPHRTRPYPHLSKTNRPCTTTRPYGYSPFLGGQPSTSSRV